MPMTTWSRANDIWLDVCRRNPKQEGEGFAEWLSRLSKLMQASRAAEERIMGENE
jgi:hypothetical protein